MNRLFSIDSTGELSKESTCQAGDWDSIPGLERFPGEGNSNPLVFLPGESHGQREELGRLQSMNESDMTEQYCA